jgi:acyl-CoA thioester hydrolase
VIDYEPPADPSAYSFTHRVRVRFAETDAMGIVHHAAYLPYLEEARVAYLKAIGHPYQQVRSEHGTDFAVIECRVRYLRPLRFDDEVDVHLELGAARRASFAMGYLLTVDGVASCAAVTEHACVDETGRPNRLPDWLRELAAAPRADRVVRPTA